MDKKTKKAINRTMKDLIREYHEGIGHLWDSNRCRLCQEFAEIEDGLIESCGKCPLVCFAPTNKNEYGCVQAAEKHLDIRTDIEEEEDLQTYIGALESLKHCI